MFCQRIFFLIYLFLILSCQFQQAQVSVTFEELDGLSKKDRVIFDGNPIGNVTSLVYSQDGFYTAKLSIDQDFSHAVTEFSRFFITTDPDCVESIAVEVRLDHKGGVPLVNGAIVKGESVQNNLGIQLQEKLKSGLSFFKEKIEQFGQNIQKYPESDAYQHMQKMLEELAGEIEQKERQTRDKIKREWLPKIQREMDELRNQLKQLGREEEMAPLDEEMGRIIKL